MKLSVAVGVGMMACSLTGCRGQTSRESPIVGIRNMYDQPRYDIQAESEFFSDRRTMRLPVNGTIAREVAIDNAVARGRLDDNSGFVLTIPEQVLSEFGKTGVRAGEDASKSLMTRFTERGEERYNIYCTPCHDRSGSGKGMVIKRGMIAPPSLHQDRIRHMPDGQLFATISNGIRNMPAYGIQVPVSDRWAIVAYVRALQLSQASLPAESNL